MAIQQVSSLNEFYAGEDLWRYDSNPDDSVRVATLLAALPNRPFQRVLGIGCGNGFLTLRLPGAEVIGCDASPLAVEWVRKCAGTNDGVDTARFSLQKSSIFELEADRIFGTIG